MHESELGKLVIVVGLALLALLALLAFFSIWLYADKHRSEVIKVVSAATNDTANAWKEAVAAMNRAAEVQQQAEFLRREAIRADWARMQAETNRSPTVTINGDIGCGRNNNVIISVGRDGVVVTNGRPRFEQYQERRPVPQPQVRQPQAEAATPPPIEVTPPTLSFRLPPIVIRPPFVRPPVVYGGPSYSPAFTPPIRADIAFGGVWPGCGGHGHYR